MRQINDTDWADALLHLGNGNGVLPRQSAPPWVLPSTVRVFRDPDEAREWLHDEPLENARAASECCLMSVRNVDVDYHNEYYLDKLRPNEEPVELLGYELREPHRPDNSPASFNRIVNAEYMAAMERPGVPPHSLKLKAGALVMCTRNVAPGLAVNGTKLVVVNIHRFVLHCRTLELQPRQVFLPRIHFEMLVPRSSVHITRRQFPVRLSYSCTINKSQGRTLARVVLDARVAPFAHGMLYVAASRVRQANQFAVLIHSSSDADADAPVSVPNVVYGELLQAAAVRAPQGERQPMRNDVSGNPDDAFGESVPHSAAVTRQAPQNAPAAPLRPASRAPRAQGDPVVPALASASASASASAAAASARRGQLRPRDTGTPAAATGDRPRARRRLDLAGAASAGNGGFEYAAVADPTVRTEEGIARVWKQTRMACGNLALSNVLQNEAGPLQEDAVQRVIQQWAHHQQQTAVLTAQVAAALMPNDNRADDGASLALLALFVAATLGLKRVFAASSVGPVRPDTVAGWLRITNRVLLPRRRRRETRAQRIEFAQRIAGTDRMLLLLPGHWVALRRSVNFRGPTSWYFIDSMGRGLDHAEGRMGKVTEQHIDAQGLPSHRMLGQDDDAAEPAWNRTHTYMHTVLAVICWTSQQGDAALMDAIVQQHNHDPPAALAAAEDEDEDMVD